MTGWLARCDPRARLAMCVSWAIVTMAVSGWRAQVAVLAVVLSAACTSAAPRRVARIVVTLALMGVFTWALDIALSPGPRLVAQWPAWVPASRAGVAAGGAAALRIVTAGLLGAVTLWSTTRDEAMDLAADVLRPLRRVPALRGLDVTVGLAAATVPLLAEEARDLELAVRFSGRPRRPGWRGRLDAARDLGIPLIIGTLHRAETLSRALEVRGYVPGARRTRLSAFTPRRVDIVWTVVSTVSAIAVLVAGTFR